ncbi:unnamed protein product [Mytilus coruscus]|uniref:MEGF10_11 n=1 Tax=Mytilus coruscus TaxID=42192 RepID=A0A6J8AYP4_MYTCO|nr:unnamed protein product [Mytilus coruscus]
MLKSTVFKGQVLYYIQYFCCQNFEERQGTCYECEIGFTTFKGVACQRCPENKFGKKCTSTCFCTRNERCNNIYGCVPSVFNSNSTYSYDTWDTTNSDNQTLNKVERKNKTHRIPITKACIGGVSLIFVVTGITCLVRRKQILQRKRKGNINHVNSKEEPHEHAYDEIEEQNMCDLPISELEYQPSEPLVNNLDRLKTGTLSTTNNGYLHPYYSKARETGKVETTSCSTTGEVSSVSSTSEDDQGYQKVIQSTKQKKKDFNRQPSVEYFEPLDISNDVTCQSAIVEHNTSNVPLSNKEVDNYYCSNEKDRENESVRQENIQMRENTISAGEQSRTPNVFSYC